MNRYRPIAQAGEGGFGDVIVAWDSRIRRKVAIKMLHIERPVEDDDEAFEAENPSVHEQNVGATPSRNGYSSARVQSDVATRVISDDDRFFQDDYPEEEWYDDPFSGGDDDDFFTSEFSRKGRPRGVAARNFRKKATSLFNKAKTRVDKAAETAGQVAWGKSRGEQHVDAAATRRKINHEPIDRMVADLPVDDASYILPWDDIAAELDDMDVKEATDVRVASFAGKHAALPGEGVPARSSAPKDSFSQAGFAGKHSSASPKVSMPWEDEDDIFDDVEDPFDDFDVFSPDYVPVLDYDEYEVEDEEPAEELIAEVEYIPQPASAGADGVANTVKIPQGGATTSTVRLEPEEPPVRARDEFEGVPGLEEARMAAMLSDDHIVQVYDFEIEGDTAYLIMEYVEGATLGEILEYDGDKLTLDMVATIFDSIARALEAAHAENVLHLDIKPDNVLINKQGKVKVSDFGIATLADVNGLGTTCGGTIGYMPLEQMHREQLDASCDQWALASLLYEMISGENPFDADTLRRAEDAIIDAELILPSLCWDGIPEELDDAIFKALDPNREDRFESISAFAADVSPCLGDAKAGRRQLAALVRGVQDEEEEEVSEEEEERIPLMERIGHRGEVVISRVVAVLGVLLLNLLSFFSLPWITDGAAPVEIVGVCAAILVADVIATIIRPGVGALVSLVALALALLLNLEIVPGLVVLAASVAWWVFVARQGEEETDVVFTYPLAGAIGLGPLAPVACGTFLSVAASTASALMSFMLAIVFAGFGSQTLMGWDPFSFWGFGDVSVSWGVWDMIVKPSTWMVGVSWVGAAAAFSTCCLKGSKAFDILGSFAAALLLGVGVIMALWAESGWGIDPLQQASLVTYVVPTLTAAVLGVVGAFMGVPDRARWEEEAEAEERSEEPQQD